MVILLSPSGTAREHRMSVLFLATIRYGDVVNALSPNAQVAWVWALLGRALRWPRLPERIHSPVLEPFARVDSQLMAPLHLAAWLDCKLIDLRFIRSESIFQILASYASCWHGRACAFCALYECFWLSRPTVGTA